MGLSHELYSFGESFLLIGALIYLKKFYSCHSSLCFQETNLEKFATPVGNLGSRGRSFWEYRVVEWEMPIELSAQVVYYFPMAFSDSKENYYWASSVIYHQGQTD